MAADANIFQSLIQPPKSIIDYQNELDQRDAIRTRNALQNLSLQQQNDQVQQGLAERNALRRVAAAWTPQTTVADRVAALRSSGMPGLMQQADALETADLSRRKTDAEINDKAADTAKKQFGLTQEKRQAAMQRLAQFTSPQDAIKDLQDSVVRGELSMQEAQAHAQRIPQDPAQFGQWQLQMLRGLMSPEQAFNASKPVLGARDNGGVIENIATDPLTGKPVVMASTKKVVSPDTAANNATSRANNAATIAAENKRASDRLAKESSVYDSDRGVVVNKDTGLARPAATMDGKPVGPKDKPLTDSQAKAYAFGSRMAAANDIIARLEQEGATKTIPGMGGNGVVGRTITAFAPEKLQQLEQAKRDWINANLRRESGAVIGQPEFDSADRQYFAQPGDSAEVIAQKAANRKRAEQGVLIEVPDARRPIAADDPSMPPDIAAIMAKHGKPKGK